MRRMQMSARSAIIAGGILLGLGLLMALVSVQHNSKVMGKAALGVAVYAPEEGSPEWRQKERLRKLSDWAFYLGVLFSLIGVGLQTYGAVAD